MKLAWALIIIGVLLFADGMVRVATGATDGDLFLIMGGLLTGLILGGFLFYKGIKRYQRFRQPH